MEPLRCLAKRNPFQVNPQLLDAFTSAKEAITSSCRCLAYFRPSPDCTNCNQLRRIGILEVHIDHKPLTPIVLKPFDEVPPRLQRWLGSLMSFSYSLSHVPGKQLLLVVDLLAGQRSAGCSHISHFTVKFSKFCSTSEIRITECWVQRQTTLYSTVPCVAVYQHIFLHAYWVPTIRSVSRWPWQQLMMHAVVYALCRHCLPELGYQSGMVILMSV